MSSRKSESGSGLKIGVDTRPPWVLFSDNGRPVAILPAGRPGEVCSCKGWTLAQAEGLVAAANLAWSDPRGAMVERFVGEALLRAQLAWATGDVDE